MDKIVDEFTRRETLIYLAGLFDGEGCACIPKEKSRNCRIDFRYHSTLLIVMADSGPVKQFHKCFGGSLNIRNMKPPHKSCYYWQVTGSKASQVAAQLLPFSHNDRKRDALQCIIEFGSTVLSRSYASNGTPPEIQQLREILHKRCCAINAQGSSANNQSPADLALIAELKIDSPQLFLFE